MGGAVRTAISQFTWCSSGDASGTAWKHWKEFFGPQKPLYYFFTPSQSYLGSMMEAVLHKVAHANNGFKQIKGKCVYEKALSVLKMTTSLVHTSLMLPVVQDDITIWKWNVSFLSLRNDMFNTKSPFQIERRRLEMDIFVAYCLDGSMDNRTWKEFYQQHGKWKPERIFTILKPWLKSQCVETFFRMSQ